MKQGVPRGIPQAHFRIGGHVVAEVIEDGALGRGAAEALSHHGTAAGHHLTAGDDAAAAALTAVVDGVVAAGGAEADAHAAAGDDDIAVGVQAVGIPGRVVDYGEAAAADVDPGLGFRIRRRGRCRLAGTHEHAAEAAAVCVQAVVAWIDLELAAAEIDRQGLNALIALLKQEAAVQNADRRVGMDAVVSSTDREITAQDADAPPAVEAVGLCPDGIAAAREEHIERALEGGAAAFDVKAAGCDAKLRFLPLDMDTLIPGADRERGVFTAEALVDVDAVAGCVDDDPAAGDDQLVIGVNAVLIPCRDTKGTAAVDCEIIAAEEHAAHIVCKRALAVCIAPGEAVFRPLGQGDKDLVSLLDADGRVV